MNPQMVFPAPPPPEIGDVISVYSNVAGGKGVMSTMTRLLVSAAVGLVVTVLSLVLVRFSFPNTDEMFELTIISLILGLIAAIAAFFTTKSRRQVSYVGTLGAARFSFREGSDDYRSDVLLFANAVELKTEQTEMYHNGVYTGTTYKYTWLDNRGQRLLRLKGTYRQKRDGTIKSHDTFHFANMAELAYTEVVLDRMDEELQRSQWATFHVNANDWIRIAPNTIELSLKGKQTRITLDQLATCHMKDGNFVMEMHDASWFGGKIRFPYSKVGNVQAFLVGLEQVVGITM